MAIGQMEALTTGADDYVTKPFSFAVLVARFRALTAAARSNDLRSLRPALSGSTRRASRVAGGDVDR